MTTTEDMTDNEVAIAFGTCIETHALSLNIYMTTLLRQAAAGSEAVRRTRRVPLDSIPSPPM